MADKPQPLAIRLFPAPPPNGRVQPWGQCEWPLEQMSSGSWGPRQHDDRWRKDHYGPRGLDPHRCALGQAVHIGTMKLCSRHAGQVALAILLGEHRIKLKGLETP